MSFRSHRDLAMTEIKYVSFGRAGRPRPLLRLSDLFLWDPQTEMEISAISISNMFEGYPKALHLFQDINRKRKISGNRAREVLLAAFEELGFPWREEFAKRLNGEESQLTSYGPWQSWLLARSLTVDDQSSGELRPIEQHFVDIEQALREPTLAWQQEDMPKCVQLLKRSRVVAPYLCPKAIERLRNASTPQEITHVRLMVMLELYLSHLASKDAQLRVDSVAVEVMFEQLFPNLNAETRENPNSLFFGWLENFSGASDIASRIRQISKAASQTDIDSTKRQLRRWKSGKGFPSSDTLEALFLNLYGDRAHRPDSLRRKDYELSSAMAKATRRINYLVDIVHRLCIFPFVHPSVQEWREDRYRHWYRYWVPRLVKSQR